MKRKFLAFSLALSLALGSVSTALAAEELTLENSGAYLFEWRPVDYGNGHSFAILVGGNTLYESDVILNRGYDYAYTFEGLTYPRPWGTVPDLVYIDGYWGIPDNWDIIGEENQPYMQIVLRTNYKTMDTNKRYVEVVHLPGGIDTSTLPSEVRKYLINTDTTDAGAYDDTETAGWVDTEEGTMYRLNDGSFVYNTWLTLEDATYYLDENGYKVEDDYVEGYYLNTSGEKVYYRPGWTLEDVGWRYVRKNGYYAQNGWIEDEGNYYYFNLAAVLVTNTITPDGYTVDENGVWDGQPSTIVEDPDRFGPGGNIVETTAYWQKTSEGWMFHDENNTFTTNDWRLGLDGEWYYLGEDGIMLTSAYTPDGYYVGRDGRICDPADELIATDSDAERATGSDAERLEDEDFEDEEEEDDGITYLEPGVFVYDYELEEEADASEDYEYEEVTDEETDASEEEETDEDEEEADMAEA